MLTCIPFVSKCQNSDQMQFQENLHEQNDPAKKKL